MLLEKQKQTFHVGQMNFKTNPKKPNPKVLISGGKTHSSGKQPSSSKESMKIKSILQKFYIKTILSK